MESLPYPAPTSSAVTAVMKGNRQRRIKARDQLRSRLHRLGFRFRENTSIDAGQLVQPDIVFTKRRVAVFVDGCFWHDVNPRNRTIGKHGVLETEACGEHSAGWSVDAALKNAGWRVIRVWEHESPELAAQVVVKGPD